MILKSLVNKSSFEIFIYICNVFFLLLDQVIQSFVHRIYFVVILFNVYHMHLFVMVNTIVKIKQMKSTVQQLLLIIIYVIQRVQLIVNKRFFIVHDLLIMELNLNTPDLYKYVLNGKFKIVNVDS
jgi:hypothetical protein